jgi:hypothetical protein
MKDTTKARRAYSPPELVRVELQHEQAILSACSTRATSNQAGNQRYCRQPILGDQGCRKGYLGDSGARS